MGYLIRYNFDEQFSYAQANSRNFTPLQFEESITDEGFSERRLSIKGDNAGLAGKSTFTADRDHILGMDLLLTLAQPLSPTGRPSIHTPREELPAIYNHTSPRVYPGELIRLGANELLKPLEFDIDKTNPYSLFQTSTTTNSAVYRAIVDPLDVTIRDIRGEYPRELMSFMVAFKKVADIYQLRFGTLALYPSNLGYYWIYKDFDFVPSAYDLGTPFIFTGQEHNRISRCKSLISADQLARRLTFGDVSWEVLRDEEDKRWG